jgi:hypothetical protein
VDSGAARCFFPLVIADRLGIREALVQDETKGTGVGETEFPTWSYPDGILGQIVKDDKELWGPEISLDPAFAEKPDFLLGMADFFGAFSITFEQGQTPPKFYVSY